MSATTTGVGWSKLNRELRGQVSPIGDTVANCPQGELPA
jgi:hypothetical protein